MLFLPQILHATQPYRQCCFALFITHIISFFICFVVLTLHFFVVIDPFFAGLDCGSSDVARMQGVLARVRGPFTPTQWMELEHQALIYKHIVANAPVPAGLLLPIRRSLHPPVFPHFSSGGILGSSSCKLLCH